MMHIKRNGTNPRNNGFDITHPFKICKASFQENTANPLASELGACTHRAKPSRADIIAFISRKSSHFSVNLSDMKRNGIIPESCFNLTMPGFPG